MKKITHHKVKELLEAYAAQELSSSDQQLVEAHIQICSACQHELAEIRHIRALLRSFALPDTAPAHIASSLHESLDLPSQQVTRTQTNVRSLHASKRQGANKASASTRLVTLIAALLTLAIIIGTATIFTFASQRQSTLTSQGSTPTPTAIPLCQTPTPTPAQSATPTQNGLPSPTPTLTLSPTSMPSPTPTQNATPSPTPRHGGDCSSPTPTPTPTDIATPTPIPTDIATPTPTVQP